MHAARNRMGKRSENNKAKIASLTNSNKIRIVLKRYPGCKAAKSNSFTAMQPGLCTYEGLIDYDVGQKDKFLMPYTPPSRSPVLPVIASIATREKRVTYMACRLWQSAFPVAIRSLQRGRRRIKQKLKGLSPAQRRYQTLQVV